MRAFSISLLLFITVISFDESTSYTLSKIQRRICSHVRCRPSPCSNPVKVPGRCCSVCPKGCVKGSKVFHVGASVPDPDPCMNCRCASSGGILCSSAACASPNCPSPIRKAGECCPSCPPGCIDPETNKWYPVGDIKDENPCRKRVCSENGNIAEAIVDCPPGSFDCPKPVYEKGVCCPTCPPGCKDPNTKKWVAVGPIPDNDPCVECNCLKDGNVICSAIGCSLPTCSSPVKKPGVCCPVCPDPPTCKDEKTGKTYPVGPIDDGNACQIRECFPSGQIAIRIIDCAPHVFKCPIPVYKKGVCCPSCPGYCADPKTLEWHPVGRINDGDDCQIRECRPSGQISVLIIDCPPDVFKCSKPVYEKGVCCPTCT